MIEKNLSRGIQWLRAVQRISRPLAFSLLDALAARRPVSGRDQDNGLAITLPT